MQRFRILTVFVVLLAVGAAGCQKLQARDNLNKGVQAFKGTKYDAAVEYFKKAKELDPSLMNARLYLATAYASMYIPGAPSEENVRTGELAVQEFREVLQIDAKNVAAIDGIGSILYNMGGTPFEPKKFEESRSYHQKHIDIQPNDADPYYWVGVINWTLSFRANNQMRAEYNKVNSKQVKDIDPLPAKVRDGFTQYYQSTVEDGIKALERAIQLKPDYDSAYAYLNLLYRQKADMATTPDERETHLAKADSLVEQFKVIKQRKMEKEAKAADSPGSN
jgi:tetratricopeptide (TPR) repeat protein